MSLQVLSAALLLAGAPAASDGTTREPAPVLIVPAIDIQESGTLPAPVPGQTTIVQPPVQTPSPAPSANPPPAPNPDNDIVITARPRSDPLAKVNEVSFAATQALDKAVIGPVALGFASVVPEPARDGLGNFLNNLQEIDVCLNFLLQHKFGKAVETAGRFLINTTLGVGGLFDVAKRRPFHLPRRRNGFSDTMGFYGVKSGAYLFLPIIGATTVRDLIGRTLDRMVVPTALGTPFNTSGYTIPTTVGSTLDTRAEFDEQLRIFRATRSPYAARRDFYLQRRNAEVAHLRGDDRVTTGKDRKQNAAPGDPAVLGTAASQPQK